MIAATRAPPSGSRRVAAGARVDGVSAPRSPSDLLPASDSLANRRRRCVALAIAALLVLALLAWFLVAQASGAAAGLMFSWFVPMPGTAAPLTR